MYYLVSHEVTLRDAVGGGPYKAGAVLCGEYMQRSWCDTHGGVSVWCWGLMPQEMSDVLSAVMSCSIDIVLCHCDSLDLFS